MPTDTRPRFRRRLYAGSIIAIAAWLASCNGALALVGAQRLAALLGQGFYNTCIAGGGVFPCLLALLGVVLADALTTMWRRVAGTDRPWSRRLAAPAACLLVVGAIACWATASLDPISDYALLPLVAERTEYAAGYSSDAFASIEPGASWDEVVARLGAPLDAGIASGSFVARWSRGVGGSSHWERVLVFDREGGRVLRRHAGLFVS